MRHGVLRSVNGRLKVHAVLPGGRVPLARTTRGPAQAHGRGGLAPAHRGSTRPLRRTRGPRGRRPPVDPRAPAGPHVRRAPVARFASLTPTCCRALQSPQHHASSTGGRAGAHQSPPPGAGDSHPGPSSGRGDGGARGARCRPATRRAVRVLSSARPPSQPSAPGTEQGPLRWSRRCTGS